MKVIKHSDECHLCVGYGEDIDVSLIAHITVAMLPEEGKVRSHHHGGPKSVLWVNYNDVAKILGEYQRQHVSTDTDPLTDPPTTSRGGNA